MVIREPEWDDEQVARMLALGVYEAGVCSGCGIHESLIDPANHFTFEDKTCLTCRGSAQYARKLADLDHKESEMMKSAPPLAPRASDGRKTYLRMMSAAEVSEVEQRRQASRQE